jgi:RNA polymerase sigma-70 factor (ECF subfamily)
MTGGVAPALDPRDLERHRSYLLRFAIALLRNHARAEDAVQETMLAAVQGIERFSAKSSVRTWLVGILRHKIVDSIRRTNREESFDPDEYERADPDLDALFKQDGRYVERPAEWTDPETALSQRRFFEVLEQCMAGLPRNTALVFSMREVAGMETSEICAALGISVSNCGVLLYRARMRLRECLEKNWFERGKDR